jgi:ABC-type uncharacterized transport system YnjBCD ATPase subunit
MIGALSPDFNAQGELWLDEKRCDTLPVEKRGLGILFQDALLFDSFSVGQNLMLALPAHITGQRARTTCNMRCTLRGWPDTTPAILQRFPAGSAPGCCCARLRTTAGAAAGRTLQSS